LAEPLHQWSATASFHQEADSIGGRQPHNYAGMPTPEGRQAREVILRAVARG
jgi:hypothetical protein